MTTCLKPNYLKDLHSGEINFSNIKGNNLEELLDNIEKVLKGGSFSTSLDSSLDFDTYELSIKDMADTVLEELGKKDLPFELNRSTRLLIRKYIYSEFLPKPLTKVEQNILAVIPGTDLISEEERRNISLRGAISEIYGSNSVLIDNTRRDQFENDLRIKTLIDTDTGDGIIIDSVQELNKGIVSYLELQYKIIRDFLISKGFDKRLLSNSLYRVNHETLIPKLVRTYYNAMQMMYNFIESEKKSGSLELELETDWENHILGKGEKTDLYNAVNAYINLTYFDDLLKDCFGEYIEINDDYDLPISLIDDGLGSYLEVYKYLFSKGNANATKNWGIEDHDSLKEMSKVLLVLIKSIPIYDYDTKSKLYGNMLPKDFIGSFTKLLDAGNLVTSNTEFANAIDDFLNNPEGNLQIIFNNLFETPNNITLFNLLEDLGIDMNTINYLYSFYRTAYKGKNSWKNIEKRYTKSKGLTSRYSLISVLLGVINSNVSLNYTQTSYDYNSYEILTFIKSKYSTSAVKFSILNNANQVTIDREDKGDILDKFKIRTDNRKDYTITLSINGNPEEFKIIANKGGILDKGFTSKNLAITNINFSEINLTSIKSREKLISGQELSKKELTFMGVVNFIDTMLGTSFGLDRDTLRELDLFLRSTKGNFKELFASASRALLVTDIYHQFLLARKDDGTKYSRTELLDFLEESGIYPDKIQLYNDKDKKKYFIKRYDGYQLSSISPRLRWLDDLAKVRAILSGNTSKSVISDLEGNKIPNYSPSFLGAKINQQISQSNKEKKASANLLFVQNPRAIKAKTTNADVVTKNGVKKLIKNMTLGELVYDAIVNKFMVPILNDNTIFTLPTTYADKTKFIMYQVSLESLGINDLMSDKFNSQIELLMINTIGKAYDEVYKEVLKDYSIFSEFTTNGEADLGKIQNWMRTHTEEDLINLVNYYNKQHKANIVFYKDLHYRKIVGGNLSINELLYEFANNLYTPEKLHSRLEKEKVNFVNNLLDNRVSFRVNIKDGKLDGITGDLITKFFIKVIPFDKRNKWIKGDRVILGKVKDKNGSVKNITYGKVVLQEGESFEINPMLNAFFMLDNLIGNNLRYSITGSEINHTIKALSKLNLGTRGALLHKAFILKYNKSYKDGIITFLDIDIALRNYKLNPIPEDATSASALLSIYDELIYKIENGGQNALFKRNVIIPGTMRPYLPGEINGIRDKMKIAVINDIEAKVFNFDGKYSSIQAHDGAAIVNPFSSILENKSLLDCEVGTIKKPILHWYNDKYMTSTLLKYAVDTMTNLWMRQSEGNGGKGVVLDNMLRKMTHIRWHNPDGSWKFGEIDLISGCDFKDSPDINFYHNICEDKNLYYRDGVFHKKIGDFGIENGVYYTIEYDVDSTGNAPSNKTKVYHYFTEDGSHKREPNLIDPTTIRAHTIDSLYELHKVLGGIYSESIDNEGNLLYSEASNYAVVQFINHVATLKEGADPDTLTLESYYQPLKYAMIDVLCNNTAIKNGAGNINPTSSFYDNTELSYMEIGTNWYGIQMDSDHTADEAQMTEFSQVISSLDAGGRLHWYVSQIYLTLGKVALDLSLVELDAVKEFRNSGGNITKIYDIIGRTIINNLSNNKDQAGLANAIITAIKREFNLNTDHKLDVLKIPFSDPNIYSKILSTFVSIINKKSIKRLYPGSGTVMVPGYDIAMVFELNGNIYLYEDLLKIACDKGFTSSHTDLNLKNRDIVLQLLTAELEKLTVFNTLEPFLPTDNVLVTFTAEVFNTRALDTLEVEYEIVREPWKEDENKEDSDPTKRYKDILRIYIKGHRELGSFDLVKDLEVGYYSVHFKTGNGDTGKTFGSTAEQRNILYENLYRAIPEGAMVSTWGNVSPGGIYALNKLMDEYIGDYKVNNIVSTRDVKDREGNTILIPVFKKFGSGLVEYDTNFSEYVSLNDIKDYYEFKENPVAFLAKRGYYNISNIHYLKDVIHPRNLSPVKISGEYDDKTGHHYINIWDHWAIKDSFNGKRDKNAIQKAFDDLDKGIWYRSPEDTVGVSVYHIEGGDKVEGANNLPAELIMSNIYKSKFGLQNGDSLIDVLNREEGYFINPVIPVISDSYDITYTKLDGKNLYITFKPIQNNDESFDSTRREWKNKIKEDFEYPENYSGPKNIMHRVFAASRDNIKLFEVGREILRENYQYDLEKKKFVDANGKVLSNQSRFSRFGESKVLEYVEFISNNEVTEIREKTSKYSLYNINRKNIREVMILRDYTLEELTRTDKNTGLTYTITEELKFDEEINTFISKLLGGIYHTKDFNGILINSLVTKESAWIMLRVFNGLANRLSYDEDLSKYVYELKKVLDSGTAEGNVIKYSKRSRSRALGEYTKLLTKKLYTSFLRSLYFTASRIPAQTLLSFMLMKNVGFTGTSNNLCFVSHWQTWLQGSDYKHILSTKF